MIKALMGKAFDCTTVFKEEQTARDDKFLISLAKSSGYPYQKLWYGVSLRKEAGQVRKVLKDFYYGNITPGEKEMRPGSKLQRVDGINLLY